MSALNAPNTRCSILRALVIYRRTELRRTPGFLETVDRGALKLIGSPGIAMAEGWVLLVYSATKERKLRLPQRIGPFLASSNRCAVVHLDHCRLHRATGVARAKRHNVFTSWRALSLHTGSSATTRERTFISRIRPVHLSYG